MTQLQDEREWWHEFVHRLCSAGPVLIWGWCKGCELSQSTWVELWSGMPHVVDINPQNIRSLCRLRANKLFHQKISMMFAMAHQQPSSS